MANSGSFARGDQPRSVPNPDAAAHARAAHAQRADNERQAAEIEARRTGARPPAMPAGPSWAPEVSHPGAVESLIPIWGSGREALADLHDGDYLGAAGNGAMAISDLALVKGLVVDGLKGAAKISGSHAWHSKPWDDVPGGRAWMGEKGHLKPGQHGHHGIIPQNGWGKAVPDFVKNQPWNIKGLDAATHGRIHGRYTVDGVKLPRFNPVERVWHGTPIWTKPAAAGAVGGAVRAPVRANETSR